MPLVIRKPMKVTQEKDRLSRELNCFNEPGAKTVSAVVALGNLKMIP